MKKNDINNIITNETYKNLKETLIHSRYYVYRSESDKANGEIRTLRFLFLYSVFPVGEEYKEDRKQFLKKELYDILDDKRENL